MNKIKLITCSNNIYFAYTHKLFDEYAENILNTIGYVHVENLIKKKCWVKTEYIESLILEEDND